MINPKDYRANFDTVVYLSRGKTPLELVEDLGLIAVATGVPVIVVGLYVGEAYGFSTELSAKIERLKLFYNEEIE